MTGTRIAFDATIARLGRAGPSVYITCLGDALAARLDDRLEILTSRWAAPLGTRRTIGDRWRTVMRDVWWHQAGVTWAARRAKCSLLHLPSGVGPLRSTLPSVVTVHDLAALRFPEFFRSWHGGYIRLVLPHLARTARAVIADSSATKADVVEFLHVPEARVAVVPLAVRAGIGEVADDSTAAHEVRARYALPGRFVLAVGTIEPRKNLKRLLEAVRRMATRPGGQDIALVHAGPGGWLTDDVAQAASALGNGRVRFLGHVSTADLAALYSLADCCAYPSLWEGFGLPVLEAMACGCPVLTSRASALPELAGGAALLVDPTSTEEIEEGLTRLWTDESLRARLKQRGLARAREFSWERAARETVAVYDAVLA